MFANLASRCNICRNTLIGFLNIPYVSTEQVLCLEATWWRKMFEGNKTHAKGSKITSKDSWTYSFQNRWTEFKTIINVKKCVKMSPILMMSEGLDNKVNHLTAVTQEKDGCSIELQIPPLLLLLLLLRLIIVIYDVRFIWHCC
jgi:hypothetical protein